MGKGDKKTRRGKIVNGSYGVRRKRNKKHKTKLHKEITDSTSDKKETKT